MCESRALSLVDTNLEAKNYRQFDEDDAGDIFGIAQCGKERGDPVDGCAGDFENDADG